MCLFALFMDEISVLQQNPSALSLGSQGIRLHDTENVDRSEESSAQHKYDA